MRFPFLELLGLVLAPALAAAEALPPQAPPFSMVTLLSGERLNGAWSAGVEIRLADGWKTYWRMPGESGVPPEFDWSKSSNLASVEIQYPAPTRFEDAGGETIGYQRRVVFPLLVRPGAADAPVDLKLTLHYAVCKDICVPATAEVSRGLGEASGSAEEAERIGEFEARVPKRSFEGLALLTARLKETKTTSVLVVELSGPTAERPLDIFVEGYERAYFRAPRRLSESGGAVFELPIDGLREPADLRGKTLTLTIVAGDVLLVRETRVE